MMFRLTNKSAVITGAGSGIGKAIAKCLAKQGASVHIIDLQPEAASTTAAEIHNDGCMASSYTCDISNQLQVKEVFGKITVMDILVNCAGVSHIGNAGNTTEAELDRVYTINIKGTYNCIHAGLPYLLKSKSPVILNVASIAAHVGISDRFAYSMSKGAVYAMTLSVARDYLQQGIRCNSISPARVHTPFVDGFLAKNYPGKEAEMFEKLSKSQPLGRMGKVEEVAALALYLCSDEAGFITGCDYPIDGGFMYINN
jgi:NAD(P)-dependent dehydrogenase (short-subunit alcohol dehydrogenase family)